MQFIDDDVFADAMRWAKHRRCFEGKAVLGGDYKYKGLLSVRRRRHPTPENGFVASPSLSLAVSCCLIKLFFGWQRTPRRILLGGDLHHDSQAVAVGSLMLECSRRLCGYFTPLPSLDSSH